MKKVIYGDKYDFILTDKEFEDAFIEWDKDNIYYCPRLDAVLTKKFNYVAPLYKDTSWEQRVLPADESTVIAYNRKKKQIWYLQGGWPYEKLLKSITGEDTFEGCIPKRMKIMDPVDERIEKIIGKTMLIDDFLDMQYKK